MIKKGTKIICIIFYHILKYTVFVCYVFFYSKKANYDYIIIYLLTLHSSSQCFL